MRKLSAIVLSALLIGGCAPMPTQEQIASANYGYTVSQYDAERQVKDFFAVYLKDPQSAQYSFGDVYKGYFVGSALEGRKLQAGYLLQVRVNAKNSYGGYVGAKPYLFLFHDAQMTGGWEVGQSGMHIKIF